MLEEDYFFGEDKDKSNTKVFALVIYDICDNKQRLKLSKCLDGYGTRVQKSAYEVKVSIPKFEKLKKEMKSYCTSVDSIRIYRINGKSEVIHFGIDMSRDIDDVILI